MRFYYYSRVSSVGQNASRQIENFKVHGYLTTNNFYVDKIPGNVPFLQRPEAIKMFDEITSLEEPVTVIIDSVDRLGRSVSDVLSTIELFNSNGINLKSLKEGFETLTDGSENPIAKLVLGVMASFSELERSRIKQRQKEGVQIAKALGKYKGRKVGSVQTPEKVLQRYPIVVQKLKKGLSIRDVAQITSNSPTTVLKVKKALAA